MGQNKAGEIPVEGEDKSKTILQYYTGNVIGSIWNFFKNDKTGTETEKIEDDKTIIKEAIEKKDEDKTIIEEAIEKKEENKTIIEEAIEKKDEDKIKIEQ